MKKHLNDKVRQFYKGKKQLVPETETCAPDSDSRCGKEKFSTAKQICGPNRYNVAVGVPLSIPNSIETHHTVEDITTENDLGDSATNFLSAINTDKKDIINNGVVLESPICGVKGVNQNDK